MPGCSFTACRTCASRSPGRAALRRRAAFLADRLRAAAATVPEPVALAPELAAFAPVRVFLAAARRLRGLAAAFRVEDPLLVALALARLAPVRPRDVVDSRAAAAVPDPGVYSSSSRRAISRSSSYSRIS